MHFRALERCTLGPQRVQRFRAPRPFGKTSSSRASHELQSLEIFGYLLKEKTWLMPVSHETCGPSATVPPPVAGPRVFTLCFRVLKGFLA